MAAKVLSTISPGGISSERELIVIVKPDLGLRTTAAGLRFGESKDVASLASFCKSQEIELRQLFGTTEDRLNYETSSLTSIGIDAPNLSIYYRVDAADKRLDKIADELRSHESVVAAYVKPPSEPAILNDMAPNLEDAPPVTPDFTPQQGYLNAAPGGIDARHAWTLQGGGGAGTRIIDIEGAWRFTHEDLVQNQGGVVGGTMSTDIGWRNHGTAVIGEFGGDRNGFGITGICPDANTRGISIFGGTGSAGAIRQAANMLSTGDIILIELHRPGPRFNFQGRNDQRGYIAVEWWPDDFDAIRYATSRGVIVVEAGGNGAENLDDSIYNTRPAGFPAGWTNPFNRANRDSGAIVVGAGAPPSGNHGPDRSRLDFSNYGALVDAQGWGREVVTCGYGDLQGGANEDVWYTRQFSGTSSASPIVVGALGCVQGVLRARNNPLMTPARARQCLRSTGSPQQDAPGRPASQRIGNRPDLVQLIRCAQGVKKIEIKEIKEKDRKEFKEIKEIKEIKEKDIKEKEKEKDLKEIKEKDRKEFKEIKEKDKDIREKQIKEKEGKEIFEGKIIRGIEKVGMAPSAEERLEKLENEIQQLAHFIGVELRPDLQESSLTNEPDVSTDLVRLSQNLQKQAADAKQLKDNKDIEKMSEG